MKQKPKKPKTNADQAVEHSIWVPVFMDGGMHEKAHEYAAKAIAHADEHRASLKAAGKHQEVAAFDSKIGPFFSAMNRALSHGTDADGKHESAGNATPKPSMVQRVKNAFKKSEDDIVINKNPGRNPKYDYKPFGHMQPEEQNRARQAFRHSYEPVEHYHYAFDRGTGEMVHGQRWLAGDLHRDKSVIASHPPKANTAVSGKSKPLPQHMPGAGVYISAPGHTHDGSYGEVQAADPRMEGKLKVRVLNKETKKFEDTFVKPHEVKIKEFKKSEDHSNVVFMKSKEALRRIKNRQGK